MNITLSDQLTFMAFWLSFSRWLAVLSQLPLFDNASVPSMVKVLTSFLVAFAFFPHLQGTLLAEINAVGVENIWILVMYHTTAGLIIGFLVKIIMSLFVATGSILTQQIGFASVSYFDPTQGQQVGPFERLVEWTLVIIILSSGALVPMFKGVFQSFFTINFFNADKLLKTPEYFVLFFKSAFSASVLLAGPLIFANLLMNLVMGIIARTIPQMNVLMVSFVVNIGLGLLLFMGIAEEFFQVSYDLYLEKLGEWYLFISSP
ncbi:MAG TPA: flagellar biosynthetic protein FliR [Bacteriovoracaceae bacterium]|nr:flagellar biosynthetic protein FliR [Bacteriovoracaceae bacterium]